MFIARDGYLFDEYDGKNQKYATSYELVWDFELIEDQTIDIDSIEEFELAGCNIKFNDTFIPTESIVNDMMLDKINKLVQAVKHLNKEIHSIKEKTINE